MDEDYDIPLNTIQKEYRLFYPRTAHDLRFQWPELTQYDEFKKITSKELLFAWYYANKTSPLDEVDNDFERITQAIVRSGYDEKSGSTSVSDLKAMRFSPQLEAAIEKMASFQPDMRLDAMKIIVQTFSNAEVVVRMDPSSHSADPSKVKALLEVQMKASKEAIEIVKLVEKNFGLTKIEEQELMEEAHDEFDLQSYIIGGPKT